jgi:hypothetical protein
MSKVLTEAQGQREMILERCEAKREKAAQMFGRPDV